jgi:hypothetical protein
MLRRFLTGLRGLIQSRRAFNYRSARQRPEMTPRNRGECLTLNCNSSLGISLPKRAGLSKLDRGYRGLC